MWQKCCSYGMNVASIESMEIIRCVEKEYSKMNGNLLYKN
jgi:hypothetical protein